MSSQIVDVNIWGYFTKLLGDGYNSVGYGTHTENGFALIVIVEK